MMSWIREYILSIIAAGVICGICVSLIPKNNSAATIIKMLGGIFLAITLVAPLAKVRFEAVGDYWDEVSTDAQAIAQEGSADLQEEMTRVIKQEVESYILDKADSMGLSLQVSVEMDSEDLTMPRQVRLTGTVSPYHQKVLSEYISKELGISEAQQIWN